MFRFGKQKTTNLANDQNDSSKWNDRYPCRIERGHKGAELQALPALAGFDPLSPFFVNAYTDTMHNAFVFGRQWISILKNITNEYDLDRSPSLI